MLFYVPKENEDLSPGGARGSSNTHSQNLKELKSADHNVLREQKNQH